MRQLLRTTMLACALALTPACAVFPTKIENPIAAARTIDQRAYALLSAYAAVIEEATDIVRDRATPLSLKRALGQAERIATPATETLQIAVAAYMRARADYAAAAGQTQAERTSAALTIAAQRLSAAIAAAQAPISELEALVSAKRS